jgi:DNA-binding NarL/FixJ family response regulator
MRHDNKAEQQLKADQTPAILIVEDHAGTRDALAALLGAAFRDWGLLTVDNAERALEIVCASNPAVVVMDISLPGIDGFEGTRLIKSTRPETIVIMHSMHTEDLYQARAAAAGASAFVSKVKASKDIVDVIRQLVEPGQTTDSSERARLQAD